MDISYKRIARRELEAQNAVFEFDGKYRFLSNFGDGSVVMYGITFPTVEHAFAAAKLDPNGGVHPRAEVVAEMHEIANEKKPGLAKKRGRRRTWNGRPFMRTDWDEIKLDLITELVRRKFQDPDLKTKLLDTGDALLVEGNTWRDRTWGMVENKGVFEGQNMLGEILMKIRAELRAN